jgi:hypothetical protein
MRNGRALEAGLSARERLRAGHLHSGSAVPPARWLFGGSADPALKRRAIFNRPSGADIRLLRRDESQIVRRDQCWSGAIGPFSLSAPSFTPNIATRVGHSHDDSVELVGRWILPG